MVNREWHSGTGMGYDKKGNLIVGMSTRRLRYLMGLMNKIERLSPEYDTAQNTGETGETVREWEVRISDAFLHFKHNERLQSAEKKRENARIRQRRHRENEKRKANGELVPPVGTKSNASIMY